MEVTLNIAFTILNACLIIWVVKKIVGNCVYKRKYEKMLLQKHMETAKFEALMANSVYACQVIETTSSFVVGGFNDTGKSSCASKVIKEFPFDPDSTDSRDYALLCAEELADKLNEKM